MTNSLPLNEACVSQITLLISFVILAPGQQLPEQFLFFLKTLCLNCGKWKSTDKDNDDMIMSSHDDDEWSRAGWLCCLRRSGERVITLKLLPSLTHTHTSLGTVHSASYWGNSSWQCTVASRHIPGPRGQAYSPP